jgi:uncharacterized protein (DUF1684 family)
MSSGERRAGRVTHRGSPFRPGFGAVAVVVALVLSACGGGAPADSPEDYVKRISADRERKDRAFANQPNEPILSDRMQDFLPLSYFQIDPSYAVPATFKAENGPFVDVPSSAGKPRRMQVVGTLEFTLKGRQLALGALAEAGDPPNRLFVPFSDLTSGTETYSAGRYLELERSPSGIYTIDFNRAFHPYCYYNHDYDCPYPPPANRLPIPVRAGEKMRDSNIPSAGHGKR